jgi:kumamolisin
MNVFFRHSAWLTVLLIGLPVVAAPITATVKLKGTMTMEQLAQNVQNPKSDHFHRFYEPAEIRKLAGPSDAQYNDLLAGLKAEGMTVIKESPTHMWVTLRGEKAIFESLFSTQIQIFSNNTHKHVSALSIPYHLSLIESVSGLDSTRRSYPHYKRADTPASAGGIAASAIRTAYGFDSIYSSGVTGSGVDIAIATYNGFLIENVQNFYQLTDISPAPAVDLVAVNGAAPYDEDSAGETELDAEMSGMIAPGANIHVFASATNDDGGELAMFTAILDDNRSKIVNYSWGGCEPQLTAQHRQDMQAVFARAVAQGVNIFVATGDTGSDTCQDGTNKADWPAAAPYVVAVGGTTLSVDGSLSETGWSGSGGGISDIWPSPDWQSTLSAPYNTMRSYPDVAFNADPNSGQSIYTGKTAGWQVVGGTSMASPQWAGFMALVAEARTKAGKDSIGYVTPKFYAMSDVERAQNFNDVVSGSNGKYSCSPGWDAVTGFGSMQAGNLLTYLSAQ